MWLRVVLSKALELKVGDQLSKNLPVNENALIYVVTEIENDGTIAMISRPIHFLEPITDLVAGKNIKPREIVDERWWYFEEET